ncbi:MAG: hypothetical protein FWG65_03545 [Turicibacter sp.]|nr:hypothetical protein [Turicibacter sp.]
MATEKRDKVYWHDAFFAAMQLEFHDYIDVLTFIDEHQLSKEALIMDVLIIKKAANVQISTNIGRIFQTHNIIEYKSETDNLTKWDYYKVVGYANLYSAFGEIPIEEITITFVSTPKPVNLLSHLANERGFAVEEVEPGIYHIKGDMFAVQILESKKLADNVFLKNLRSELTKHDMARLLYAYQKYGVLERTSAYLSRIFAANAVALEGVKSMTEANVQEILYRHFKEKGWIDRDANEVANEKVEDSKRETAFEMLQRNFDIKDIAAILKMPTEWVQNLATTSTDSTLKI